MRRNLVVVRAGDRSLHEGWLAPERSFDLVVSYYGRDPGRFRTPDVVRIEDAGSKWQGLRRLLESADVDWRRYERVWLPDDDLRAEPAAVERLFATSAESGALLAQPALAPGSFFTFAVTLQARAFRWRRVNFVEVMAPCFATPFLAEVLPTFAENASGWGLDLLWAQRLIASGRPPPVIVDEAPVTHTRPVGSAGHGGTGLSPWDDYEAVIRKYRLPRPRKGNLGGRTVGGADLELPRDRAAFVRALVASTPAGLGAGRRLKYLRYALRHAWAGP
jgi:hypothetical protein